MRKFFLFLFLFYPFILHAEENRLEICDQAGTVLYSSEISPECGFVIQYIHSVALTPVKDYFIAKDGDIYLAKTEYQDFGAGLPSSVSENQSMKIKDKMIILDDINHKVSPFTLRVGRIAHHKLVLFKNANGKCEQAENVPLKTLAKPGAPLTFKMADKN